MRVAFRLLMIGLLSIVALSGAAVAETPDAPTLVLNGKVVQVEIDPVIVEGTTLIPFRAISELTGAAVDWDSSSRTATARKGGTVVALVVGSSQATINGTARPIGVPPQIVSGRTMVPLRFVSEALGLTVQWDEQVRAVLLESQDKQGSSATFIAAVKAIGERKLPSVRPHLGGWFFDLKTNQRVRLVSILPSQFWNPTYSSDWVLLKFVSVGGDVVWCSYKGYGQVDRDLMLSSDWDVYAGLTGKIVWVKTTETYLPGFKNLEPVTVVDVKPGSLLDAIELSVETNRGLKTVSIRRSYGDSWVTPWPVDDYFITQNPRELYPGWSDDTWRLISEGKVRIGMNREQATLAWGRPEDINKTITRYGTSEQWVYDGSYLYFEDGILDSLQN